MVIASSLLQAIKNLEESKMSDRDRIENEFKTNLKRIKVQIEKGNKSPKRKGK